MNFSVSGKGDIKMKKATKRNYLIDEKGEKKAVVIPIREYEELMEDLHDLAVIAERRNEPTSSFEDVLKRLKADGFK